LLDAIGVALGVTDQMMTYTLERRPEIAGPLRLLVVDDNLAGQEFAAESLRRLGHVVTTAANGAEALEILAKRTFDVILLDVQMPELDGLEVTRRLRASERGVRTPMIAVTAHATVENRERCIAAGFDGVLTKPATQATLGAIIREATGIASARSPDRPGPADAILDAVGGNVALLSRVRDAFAMQTPRLLTALREAVATRDGDAIFQTAHTLKGSISNFDVPDAIAATAALERAGKTADFARAAELLPTVEAAIQELSERIEAALG
jgi:CheY-like chemotaxis protein